MISNGESTKESLIVTLKELGKNKEGKNIFQIEPFKQKLFRTILKNRILVVMGYSGYDDFDIIPTLKILTNLKKIIWINHIKDLNYEGEITEINKLGQKPLNKKSKVDSLLLEIKKMNYVSKLYKIIIVNGNKSRENFIDLATKFFLPHLVNFINTKLGDI